jgi:hypothetical protein
MKIQINIEEKREVHEKKEFMSWHYLLPLKMEELWEDQEKDSEVPAVLGYMLTEWYA